MLARLLVLFLLTPIIELALLIQLGEYIGFWPTVGIIVLTGVTGTFLAKREGLAVWRKFNERLRRGELPGIELIDGVTILVAGALLITPGVLTDVAGLLGLFPPTRLLVRRIVERKLKKAVERGTLHVTLGGFESYGTEFRDKTGEPGGWSGKPKNVPGHGND